MLGESTVFATVAVKDPQAAKAFYEGTLGMKIIDENPAGVTYQSGTGKVFVYQSEFAAGSGQATCAAWEVTDIDTAVKNLSEKSVKFEHYDLPHVTWEGDVAVMGPLKAAWFKDPDGNILSIGTGDNTNG